MITPRATEKAYVAQSQRTYIFFVPKAATKQAIAKAIAEEFKVTVTDVRTANRKGKATRFSRGKHAYPGITYRQDHKVAYITVKEGDKIPVFEEVKTDDKKAESRRSRAKNSKADSSEATPENLTTKSADKKAEKEAEKTAKKAEKAEKKTTKKAEKETK